jgi:parallel beta-helix repeat protein
VVQFSRRGLLGAALVAVAGCTTTVRRNSTAIAQFDGSDETTTLQASLTAAAGGTLIVPRGKTIKTKTVTVPAGTTLAGKGPDSVIDLIDDGTTTSSSIYVNNVAGVTIRDLKIRSSSAVGRTGVYGLIRCLSATGLTIRNCVFTTSPSVAIWTQQCTDVLIQGNHITSTFADGIHISRNSVRVKILNNDINGTGDDGIGIVSYSSTANPFPVCQDIIIEGNTITNSPARGIAVVGGDGILVRGNTIRSTSSAGILVGGELGDDGNSTHFVTDVTVDGNTVTSSGLSAAQPTRQGIYVSHARGGIVQGNIVSLSAVDGIAVGGVNKEITVANNYVFSSGGRGINIAQATSTDARLILELFTNRGESGVTTAGISEIVIDGNTIRSCSQDGINAAGASGAFIPGCTISNNSVDGVNAGPYYAILANYLTRSVVSGNRTKSRGIALLTCTDTVVNGNSVCGVDARGIFILGGICQPV